MVSDQDHGISPASTMHHTMKNSCLAMPESAWTCQTEGKKNQDISMIYKNFLPAIAGPCQTPNHSHSFTNEPKTTFEINELKESELPIP
ncbi:MAG: hypothetical protein LBI87_10100 [Candidatus Accumulibacter sp.]|jgi:hypothetical protein|nr:hypothetical protein [Accumulibacter sp.]